MAAPKKFKKPAKTDSDAVRVSPRDLVGSLLLINVKELKEGIKTKFSPEGCSAISIDVVSIETGNMAEDQLWFNGALVDQLADYVGEIVPCRLEWVNGGNGYPYLSVAETTDADDTAVEQFLAKHNDIFDAAPSEAPAPASNSQPAAKARW